MASVSSDQVFTGQSGSGQRHSRLRHTSTTRRSPMDRSRILTPPAVADRPCAAALTTDHGGGRLHLQPQLAVNIDLRADHEAVHAQERSRALTTVHPHGASHLLLAFDSRNNGEAPQRVRGPLWIEGRPITPHA